MVEVSNNFIQECEANVGTYKFGKIKVNYIDDNPFNYEQGAYSSSNGAKIDAEQSIRYNKLVECEPNFKYKIELGNSAYKMKIVTYNANQAFIAAHDNLTEGSELTTESTAAYISVTIYSNDTLEGTSITLNNTIRNSEISGAELKGNTSQDGTPTPSSPIPVNNVTGEQIIGIYKHNFLSLKDNIEWRADNTITKTIIDDDNITISYSGENATYKRLWQDNNLQIPNGHYDISCIATCTDNNVVVGIGIDVYPLGSTTRSDWHEIWFTQNAREQGVRVHNDFEIDNSQYYYRIRFFLSQSTGTTSNSVQFKDIMLKEYGDETEYENYQGKDYEINLGKNLLDLNLDKVANQNGITYSVESDGTITINGTATAQTDISHLNNPLKSVANKKYSLNFIYISGTLNGTMNIFNQDGNNGWKGFNIDLNGTGVLSNKSAVGSYTMDLYMKGARFIRVKKDAVVDNLKFKLTFVQSDVADYDYVPYFTPIELNKIGDYQDYIRKGTGKNLFDKNTITTGYRLDNNVGDITEQSGSFCSNYIKISQNTTYTKNSPTADAYHRVCFYSSQSVSGFISRSESNTFTTPSNCKYLRFCGYETELDKTMLEKAPSATSFEPYGYKDKWYIEKNVGKEIFDGSSDENWFLQGSGTYYKYQWSKALPLKYNVANSPIYCSHFQQITVSQGDSKNTIGIANGVYSGYSIAIVTNITTLEDFKTWLTNNNTSVYYQLANPTYTLIENEELIEQLDTLSHAETQEGTTNITSSGILPAILEVTPNLIESIRGKQTTPIVGYNITGEDDLINFKITSKADSNGNILGATSQSQVDIEIFNENNAHNLENKQVYISTGLNETEGNYCKWQPFTITQTKDTQTKNHTTYTGYDDMMRGNEAYIDNVDYGEEGVTLYDFTCKLAKEMGMALGNTTMTNGEFIVKGNNFTNNETKLVVLKNIAQMVGGFAMIDRDNLLRIVELSPEDAMTPIELTTNLYTEAFQNSAKFGEINEFAIGETNIETNAIVRSDDTSIAKNGVKKIEILDNIFLGLLEDKELAIEPLWDAFNGFSYYPFKTPYNGYPYIDLGDKLNITDINNNIYSSFIFNYVFEYNGGYKGNVGAEALSVTAAKYKTNNTLSKQFRKVGIDIDRVKGEITAEIAAREDTTEQLSQLSQTVNEINSTVSTTTTTVSDLETRVQTNETSISQNADSIIATVTRVQKTEDDVETLQTNTEDVVNQLVFGDDGLTISAKGSTSDDMKLNLTNDAIKFLYQNNAVLTINGSTIEFSNASFKKLDLGNYVWQAEDDDSLSLIYEGD